MAKLLESGGRSRCRAVETVKSETREEIMFIHIFGFRWKPEATDADKARAAHDIAAFRDHILGLIDVHVGPEPVAARAGLYVRAG